MSEAVRFDPAPALASLKTFQRRTVDYVFRRFFEDADHTRQFLVADEVGLGKTMVAKGLIARTIAHLWDSVERIDVLYICTNQALAAQNVARLNVLGGAAFSLPTRMTLLPLQLSGERGLNSNKVNFVSLTPGTTFDLRSSTGIVEERALLYRLLKDTVEPKRGLYNLLRVGVEPERWEARVDEVKRTALESSLVEAFRAVVRADAALWAELTDLCVEFHRRRDSYPHEMASKRNKMIGRLRALLSTICVSALQPDLIILDEFQRFSDLLRGDTDAAILAQQLFDYTDSDGHSARTLLLSATPYRMITLRGDTEEEGDHFKDFLATLSFLFGKDRGQAMTADLDREMTRFRIALFNLPDSKDEALQCRSSIESQLRRVMARTERVASSEGRDAMVREPPLPTGVEVGDLRQAIAIATVARALGAPEIIEYWKSAPYLLNFMRDYALKKAMNAPGVARSSALLEALAAAKGACLSRDAINAYEPLQPSNGRMRTLMADVFEIGLDQHLWIPPSLAYYGDTAPSVAKPTKALVFSAWSMVPDAIAAMLSYEAERRMGVGQSGMRYFDRQRPRPLQFRRSQERLAGLRTLHLIYPSPLLAEHADPLTVFAVRREPLSYEEMRRELATRLRPFLLQLQATADSGPEVPTWEWAGPAVLDALSGNGAIAWLLAPDLGLRGLGEEDAYAAHIEELHAAAQSRRVAGAVPDSVLDLLVDLALGSPAVCALRALRRAAPDLAWDDPKLLAAASRIAWGFRVLYNHHDTVALLRREGDDRYWHAVIAHAARENLQAVLDEYVHCLVESEGLLGASSQKRVERLAEVIQSVLMLRPSQIEVDDPQVHDGILQSDGFTMRGRFAMRLADYRDEEGGAGRLGGVRDAFNSPFRPFVLATTSIGQEGLDFHPYCYRLYHWNLPHNPVDLEQREGRIHRYKGHAIRLNVADQYAQAAGGDGPAPTDPWAAMFATARKAAKVDNDLMPYWICDGPTKVERRVPLLPFSTEIERLRWLKKSVAVYRLSFGQPRQDDLLEYLTALRDNSALEDFEQLHIRLAPA